MKIILISSASGGTAKTTVCVRLSELLSKRGIPTGVLDLSPWPTAHAISSEGVDIIRGTGAGTIIGAESIIKPYQESHRLLLVDTGRIDDPEIVPWFPLVDSIVFTISLNAFGVSALPAIWESIEKMRKIKSNLNMMGMLPVLTRPEDERVLQKLNQKFPGQFIAKGIPFDLREIDRVQREYISGLDKSTNSISESDFAYKFFADKIVREFYLQPTRKLEEPKIEKKGLLAKLWKSVRQGIGGRVSVTEGTS